MATAFTSSFASSGRQPAFHAPVPVIAPPAAPSGTFAPGTKVQVGGHRVVIEKYLSEGGFAHVYLVRLPKPINGDDEAVLKRVAVPDKEALANMRTEVETMKKLKGRRHIVTYMDSHASELRGGGYEVFLLMEYCNGGGLIDFMNTRLQNRLTEPEILSIFSDVAQGVADMHYLNPPLLHRDLKVENVLITSAGTSRRYKLCDFGSAAVPTPAAKNAAEGRLIEDDVQKHTTLQYRSPEMIDVYRKQPIDEKSDIWALGVLLYKLCYYKTPFEDQGQIAILNVRFKFPGYPIFSDDLKTLIASMLRENPLLRPNIYQVVRNVCFLRGTDIPIKDIYAARNPSEVHTPQQSVISPPIVGAYQAPLVEEKQVLPDIAPMRRGRPMKTELEHRPALQNPAPTNSIINDPFEALDSNSTSAPNKGFLDDVSSRFPPLDEFSILHDSGNKFAFDLTSEPTTKAPKDIRERVTDALADDAFARPLMPNRTSPHPARSTHLDAKPNEVASISKSKSPQLTSGLKDISQRPVMVSTGTMTSPPPPSTTQNTTNSPRPTFRFPPSEHRSSSHPRGSSNLSSTLRPNAVSTKSSGTLATSARSSLEGQRPPMLDTSGTINRSKSVTSRARPKSVYAEGKSNISRSRDVSRENLDQKEPCQEVYVAEYLQPPFAGDVDNGIDASKISSNVEFLRAIEEQDQSKRKEKRLSSGSKHIKRSSMPSISLSGTKSLLAGRFGDAFRRFESGPGQRGSSPSRMDRDLAPIAGSEQTDSRSDDGYALEETEAISPEVRRELERRRLSQEEKRVADAGAAYRQKLAEKSDDGSRGGGGPLGEGGQGVVNSRAASIQSKVKTLLDENGRASPSKPAQEFTRFPPPQQPQQPQPPPQQPPQPQPQQQQQQQPKQQMTMNQTGPGPSPRPRQQLQQQQPPLRTKPLLNHTNSAASLQLPAPVLKPPPPSSDTIKSRPPSSHSSSAAVAPLFPPRPNAPPKPHALRTANRDPTDPTPSVPKAVGKPQPHIVVSDTVTPSTAAEEEDWKTNFSKRYPDLAGLEMVETEIDGGGVMGNNGGMRVRDV